jgi:aryl-alcohol dehydrogenase-like predicted oxidoreductase
VSASKLALGTVQFGIPYGVTNDRGQVPLSEVEKILETAKENGVDTLDTAIAYGESEAVLGRVGVEGFKVITKIPEVSSSDPQGFIESSIETSLRRLNISSLNAIMLHRPAQLWDEKVGPEIANSLEVLRDQGIAKKVGVSVYSPQELVDLRRIFDFDIFQAPMNVMDRRFAKSDVKSFVQDNRIEMHIRSVFLQGILLQTPDALPAYFMPWLDWWNRWESWLSENNCSAQEACLSYVGLQSAVSKMVLGVTSDQELKMNLDSLQRQSPKVPDSFAIQEELLINPSNWKTK